MGTPNYPAADVPDYDDDGDTGLDPDPDVFDDYAEALSDTRAEFTEAES